MARKEPGLEPLGHGPFSNISLEGPKKKHDFHGNNASRPKYDDGPAVPKEHWEMHYNLGGPSRDMIIGQGGDFNPMQGRYRDHTHIKVNEADH